MDIATTDVTTKIESGAIRGRVVDGAATYLGIPFAAPPVGRLRFQAPQPVPRWQGTRDCFDYGPTAPQPDRGKTLIPEPMVDGDDYLNLNVFTPTDAMAGSEPGLPVLVWIHGGGFFGGGNRSPWFRGNTFTRDGIVFVSINYRLGAEGFMPMRGAPSNRGVLDWLAALQWVQDNIAAFGGDPDNVTIAGQSAGAMACTYLLAMPRARGLFRQVIGMSGSIGMGLSAERAEAIARDFKAALGVADNADEIARIPVDRFLAAQTKLSGEEGGPPNVAAQRMARGLLFQPVVDGELIPQSAAQAVAKGVGADIPVLLSFTSEEFCFMTKAGQAPYSAGDLAKGLALLGLTDREAAAYAAFHRDRKPDEVLGLAISDRCFRAQGVRMAEARIGAPAPTYLCEFRWSPTPPTPEAFGACHCIDVPFAFDMMDAPELARMAGPNPPQSVATAMHGGFARFVKSGDPGWAAYRAEGRTAMLLDEHSRVEKDPFRDERALWDGARWIPG